MLVHDHFVNNTSYLVLVEYLFSCLCIEGMAEHASLFVLAWVTRNFSGFLVSTIMSLSGNISSALGFLVHLSANFRLSLVLLDFKVGRIVTCRAHS